MLALFQIQVALVHVELLLLPDVLPDSLLIQTHGAHPYPVAQKNLRLHAGSLEALRVTRPEAVGLTTY